MSPKMIHTDKAPKPIAPYSQAVRSGNLVFCSGQGPIDPKTGKLELYEGNAAKQAKLVMNNLKAVLAAEGLTLNDVIKTTVFLSDMKNFSQVNEVYASFFGEYKPARSAIEASRLPWDIAVEIEAIAEAK